MEVLLPLPPPPPGDSRNVCRRDNAEADAGANAFDVQQHLESVQPCCSNLFPSLPPPNLIQDQELSADLQGWPSLSFNPRWPPCNVLAAQHETCELQLCANSSSGFHSAGAARSILRCAPIESPEIPDAEEHGEGVQKYCVRSCRKEYILLDQNGCTGSLVSMLSPQRTLGAGYDGQKAAGTTVAMAYAAIQETRRGEILLGCEPIFLGNDQGAATRTATDPLQEPESTSSCGSHRCKELTIVNILETLNEEMSSNGQTPGTPDALAAQSDTEISTSVISTHTLRDLKSPSEEQGSGCIRIKHSSSSSSKRQKRRFRYTRREVDNDPDAKEEDDEEVSSSAPPEIPSLQHNNNSSSSGSMPLQLQEGQAEHPKSCRNYRKKRSVRSGSLEDSTTFSNRSEPEDSGCSKLKLRKKVKALRGMIPGGEHMTDTSLVLDEAIHYVKLLQLHVQMLENQRTLDTRIHTW